MMRTLSIAFLALLITGCSNKASDSVDAHGGHAGHDTGSTTGSDTGDDGDTTGDAPEVGDTYVVGLEKTDDTCAGKLMLSDPIPAFIGKYTWTVQVADADGNALPDHKVEAEPTMPQHGHGTWPQFTEGAPAEDAANGEYTLTEMDLFMPGLWRVDIRVTGGDDLACKVTYWFALEG